MLRRDLAGEPPRLAAGPFLDHPPVRRPSPRVPALGRNSGGAKWRGPWKRTTHSHGWHARVRAPRDGRFLIRVCVLMWGFQVRCARVLHALGTSLLLVAVAAAALPAAAGSTFGQESGSCGDVCDGRPCTGFLIRSGTCQPSGTQCICVPNTPAPGECALACDGRACVTHCPDGATVDGFCTDLTVDTGCACSATCTTPSVTPAPTPSGPTGICCQTLAGAVPQCTTLSPFSNEAYQFCLAIGVPYLAPPFNCSQQTGTCEQASPTPPTPTGSPLPAATPTPQCAIEPCGGACVSCPFCPPGRSCNGPVCLVGTCQVVSGSCACVTGIVTPSPSPTPVATPTEPCSARPCGGTCALCPPCTPGTICPELACRLGSCEVVAGNCACVTDISTPGPSSTPTPPTTFTPVPCLGDCNGDGRVAVDELVVAVRMALGDVSLSACPVFEHCNSECGPGPARSPSPGVAVDCLVRAVSNALGGCPPARCASDQDCDDGNPCTFDRCTPTGCVNECVCN